MAQHQVRAGLWGPFTTLINPVTKAFDGLPPGYRDEGRARIEVMPGRYLNILSEGSTIDVGTPNENEWKQLREQLLKLGWSPAADG